MFLVKCFHSNKLLLVSVKFHGDRTTHKELVNLATLSFVDINGFKIAVSSTTN